VGRAVLLEPYEPEIMAGKIFIPATVRERTMMVETRAVVIAVGPIAWKGEPVPRAMVGDKVLITKYCGAILIGPKDEKQYRMVNDEDIFARIEE
jgi:co-chaperonin GroES (HSP10)